MSALIFLGPIIALLILAGVWEIAEHRGRRREALWWIRELAEKNKRKDEE